MEEVVKMNITFRRANFADVEGIIALCNECFDENTDVEYAKRVFKETENDQNQIYIVGLDGDKIIAHAKVTIIPTIYGKMGTYSILNHVCVKKEYRRHNIASRMLDECQRISKENGCVKMELWSMNFREAAHACYKNYGFVVDDAKFFSKEVK